MVALQQLQASEETTALGLMRRAVLLLNAIEVVAGPSAHARRRARLLRLCGRRARLDSDFLMTVLLSTKVPC